MQPTRKAVGCDQSFTILQESFGPSETSLQRTASMFLAIILFIHISYSQLVYILFDVLPLEHKCSHLWAARYNTWLLIKLTPKGVVFSFLSFPFPFLSFPFLSFPFLSFPFLSFSFLFFSAATSYKLCRTYLLEYQRFGLSVPLAGRQAALL